MMLQLSCLKDAMVPSQFCTQEIQNMTSGVHLSCHQYSWLFLVISCQLEWSPRTLYVRCGVSIKIMHLWI